MNYLIDTDWVIDHLNGVEQVTQRLKELVPYGLSLSILPLAELYEGIYHSQNPVQDEQALSRFLTSDMVVLGIDEEIARTFGKERGRLRQQGRTIGDIDLLIASTCLYHNLTLLTNNRKHFEVVDGLKIISV